ncbi:hypothetical protein Phou_046570 [Phytohabitans houttuyneae]|uniref:Uncharacterized protein n=1 Tax=Phytohabitans houttuyneae TaxID=1076126 RepID=A0A6V8KFJ6_9ACTN|nr:hypothetical protein Phou_046570 [Phytohabitans houttuyneae]
MGDDSLGDGGVKVTVGAGEIGSIGRTAANLAAAAAGSPRHQAPSGPSDAHGLLPAALLGRGVSPGCGVDPVTTFIGQRQGAPTA